nr:hypothetical protein [Roseibacillus persicicus]
MKACLTPEKTIFSGMKVEATKKDALGRLERFRASGRSRSAWSLGLVAKALFVAVRAHTLLPLMLIDFCFPAFL